MDPGGCREPLGAAARIQNGQSWMFAERSRQSSKPKVGGSIPSAGTTPSVFKWRLTAALTATQANFCGPHLPCADAERLLRGGGVVAETPVHLGHGVPHGLVEDPGV